MIAKYGDISGGKYWYHGTSSEYLESILSTGLLVPSVLGISPRSDRTCEVDMGAVYLTRLHHIAVEEATIMCQDAGGVPVVLVVEYSGVLVEDPEFPFDTLYLEDVEEQPMCIKTTSIPASDIVEHQVVEKAYLNR